MPDVNGEPTEEEAVEAIYSYAAQQMRAGVNHWLLVDDLIAQGVDHEVAKIVVRNLNERVKTNKVRSLGIKRLKIGGVMLVIGTGITVGTYILAASGGGSYIFAYGAMGFGAIYMLAGLIQLVTGKGK